MKMEQKDIVAIFNEMLTKVYNEQEEKYKRKRKYELEHYCCTEDEKDQLSIIFEGLLEKRETQETRKTLDLDAFINLISGEEE